MGEPCQGGVNMKLIYIFDGRIPTQRAHGLHIVKMCEALGRIVDVTLVVPGKATRDIEKVFTFYGLEKTFSVHYIPTRDFISWGRIGYWINQLAFTRSLFSAGVLPKPLECRILTRDGISGWVLARRGYRVFYDMHGVPHRFMALWRVGMRAMQGIVVTNRWKVNFCKQELGLHQERFLVAPNAFDPRSFSGLPEKEELRKRLNLPLGPIIAYTGHLYDWKGAEVLAQAAKLLSGVTVLFVGGTEQDVARFRKKHEHIANILLLGFKPYTLVPHYLKAVDVLVLPNSNVSRSRRLEGYSKFETSPIKLFEYMASGRPIVASDMPSIREILDEKSAVFVTPDDPEALARGIQRVLNKPVFAAQLGESAKEAVKKHTWDNRAVSVYNFINSHS